MDITYDRDSNGLTSLAVTVPPERVDEIYQRALRDFRRHVSVPGFRQGKVPAKMVESIVGTQAIADYAKDLLRDQVLPEAFGQVPELVTMGEPELELGEFRRGEPCALVAKVVCAKVDPGEYKGVAVEQYRSTATDEEAEAEIQRQYRDGAERSESERQTVEAGDEIDFTLRIIRDGVLMEDFSDDDPLRVELGNNQLNPNIDEHLIGLTVGEAKVFEVTYPDDYSNENLRGAVAEFAVTVLAINTRESVEEFLRRQLGLEEVDGARAAVRAMIENRRQTTYRIYAREEAVRKIVEQAEVDIPSAQVEADVMEEIDEFEERLEAQGIDLDDVAEQLETEYERIRERITYDAKRSVVLRSIAAREEIALEQDDLIREISMMSSMNQVDPRLMMRRLEEQGMLGEVANNARLRKTADQLLDWAAVTEVDPPVDEDDEDEVDAPVATIVEPVIGATDDDDETAGAEPEDEPCP